MLWAFLFVENMIIAFKNCHKAYFVTVFFYCNYVYKIHYRLMYVKADFCLNRI
jgi:hypothetical protein